MQSYLRSHELSKGYYKATTEIAGSNQANDLQANESHFLNVTQTLVLSEVGKYVC